MPNARRAVDEVAAAILEGTPVNWDHVESTSAAPERELIPFLRVVARIAEAHRTQAGAARADVVPFPPATWAHLRVLERLGSGAFGDVYRAWDTRLDREVALKLRADDEPARDGSTVVAEGRLLARVRHPNVVTVYGAERLEGRVGLWMELIRGRRLDQVLQGQGPFGAHEAAIAGLTVCRALAAVHGAGLLHRDIKAQNVMREDGGRLVLMDFGNGLLESDPGEGEGRLAGTPLYLAPELFAGAAASVEADIYGVGVLLFHLVSGSFPVAGRSVDDLRRAHAEGRKRFLRDERSDLPDEFVAVVERALARDPAARFASAGAMEDALARVVAGGGGARRPAVTRRVWAALAAAGVAAALAAASHGWPDRARGSSAPIPPGPGAVAAAISGSPVAVRRVAMPPALFIGRPSPDGRAFSFTDLEGNLALVDLESGSVRRLTSVEPDSDQHAAYSAISADGRSVAYTWLALDGRYELRMIGADGRRPRVLVRSDEVDVPRPIEWARDGTSILCGLARRDGEVALALVSADDGSFRVVRRLTADVRHASLSPDGQSLVYDAPQRPADPRRDIFLARSDGSAARALVAHPASDAAPVWTPDGRRVLFVSDRSGAPDLWSVAADAPDAEPQLVHRGLGRMWILGLTDAGTYYYQALVGAVEVYAAEWPREGPLERPAPLGTRFAGSNISSAWSPDGRQVAYASRRGPFAFDRGSTVLVLRHLETGAERELVPTLASFLVRSWSPDGGQVVVAGTDYDGRGGAYAVDVDSGRTHPLVQADRPSDATNLGRPDWAPDGSGILYSNQARRALLFRELPGGADRVALDFRAEGIDTVVGQVLGRGYRLSPDGRTLAFTAKVSGAGGEADVLRVKTGGEPSRELLRVAPPERIVLQDWTPDGLALVFTRRPRDGAAIELWTVDAGGGAPRPMGLALNALRDVSVHPGGGRLTFTAGAPVLEVWALERAIQ